MEQPLIQFDPNVPVTVSHQHQALPPRGLQLNINKLNQFNSNLNSDENAAHQPLGQPPLKPLANHQQQITKLPPTAIDENFDLQPFKAAFANLKGVEDDLVKPPPQASNNGGRDSPREPSPPKFKLYSRNSLRQHLPPQQPPQQQQPVIINLKQAEPQQQHSKQQESIISRIPRLSFAKLPLNNGGGLANRGGLGTSNSSGRLAPLAELRENVIHATRIKLDHHHNEPAVLQKVADEKQQQAVAEEEIEDIDKSSSRDAIYLVSDVAKDIYDYMFELEETQSISRQDYLKEQKIFTPKVRQRLTNWCIEIHSQLKLLQETLYLTIAIIDRFFDKVQVKQQSQVQLVALGATLIASKYEEIYPPDVGDLMHLTQNSYTRREIMRVEIQILEQLNFDLGKPIPLVFLRRFSKAAHCDSRMHAIGKYLMELSLSEYECAHWRPSLLAAAALYTTIQLTRTQPSPSASAIFGSLTRRPITSLTNSAQQQTPRDDWTRSLVHYTRYSRKQLQEPCAILCKMLKRAQKSPQSFACVKKNLQNLVKWPELKSAKVDELIKLGGGGDYQI